MSIQQCRVFGTIATEEKQKQDRSILVGGTVRLLNGPLPQHVHPATLLGEAAAFLGQAVEVQPIGQARRHPVVAVFVTPVYFIAPVAADKEADLVSVVLKYKRFVGLVYISVGGITLGTKRALGRAKLVKGYS